MNRIEVVQSIFRRYQAFSARGNYVVAMSLFERGKSEAQPTDKKILFLYLFYLLINSCETVIRLTRILRNIRLEDPLQNLLRDDKIDFQRHNLLNLRRDIEDCESNPVTFFTKYCQLEIANTETEKDAIKGILLGIKSALNNILAVDQHDSRVLWRVYNRLKHGFTVLNKEERESVVFYLLDSKGSNDHKKYFETPVELKVNEELAKKWLDTIHALSNTQRNLSHVIGNLRLSPENIF